MNLQEQMCYLSQIIASGKKKSQVTADPCGSVSACAFKTGSGDRVSHPERAVGRSPCKLVRWSGSRPLQQLLCRRRHYHRGCLPEGEHAIPAAWLPAWPELQVAALPGQSLLWVFCVNPGMEHAELGRVVRPVPGLPGG